MSEKVTAQEVVGFKHQFAGKIAAGETMVEALYHMVSEQSNNHLAYVATQMCADLQAGIPLPVAMAKHTEVFDAAYLHSLEEGAQQPGSIQEALNLIRGSSQ